MLRTASCAFSLILLAGFTCRADLTIRYTSDMKAAGAMQQMPAQQPKERVIRVKGDKTLSSEGPLTEVIDNARAEITVLDPAKKEYARIPITDYAAALQAAMPVPAAAQQAMQNLEIDVQKAETGQTALVFGIRAQEHLVTLSMSMNIPGAAPGSMPVGLAEIRTWLASPDDLTRIPALREYAAYAERAMSLFSSANTMQSLLSLMPAMGETMRALGAGSDETAGSLTVKMEEKVYMSMPGMSSKAPLLEMDMNLAGISTDTIDDAIFDVPPDYQTVAAAELLKELAPAPKP